MMTALLDDPELRACAERITRGRGDVEEAVARAAWSVIAEPGDGVAGALIGALGAGDALQVALRGAVDAEAVRAVGSGAPRDVDGAETSRALRDARARWRPRARPAAVADAVRTASARGVRLLLPGDPCWPSPVDDLESHAPVALWVRGDPAVLRTEPSVAIVGARAATNYGEGVTAELAGDLASSGALIVSGGAYGIDGAAHRAALGTGGRTVAFLAGGVDRAYPVGHERLFTEIARRGAVISEVPCGTTPTKWRFLARNRLIAASTSATVVVEAGWRSGSLNTAGHAAALGRPLGAVPGPITSPASAGCHRLLREYDARCVTTAAEIRELWGEAAGAPADAPAHPDTVRLLDAMSTRTAHSPEELARRSGMSADAVRSRLGMLELEQRVRRSESGGWVAAVVR